ncbi:MAG: hypothetical protein EXS00_07540 [Phycisphaerales bacterium]|nr:hypothetical protein [Phycisphaerales bacterium]
MLIYAGIDEAGYGPLIGPMCIAATVWAVPLQAALQPIPSTEPLPPRTGALDPPDLWQLLRQGVCRRGTDKRRRVAIDDSKKLKLANSGAIHPLSHLERGVLACLRAGATRLAPQTDSDLFAALGSTPPADRDWYQGTAPVPCCHDESSVQVASNLLAAALRKTGVELRSVRCVALDAAAINQRAALTGNKAAVSGAVIWDLVTAIVAQNASPVIRIALDRQGGRIRYREDVQRVFPQWSLRILSEDEVCSRYLLHAADHTIDLSFQAKGELHHLPIALASMTAKYVRELWMARLNRFFQARLPGLTSTAGYVQDGRRYVEEIKPLLQTMNVPLSEFVREV